MSSLLAPACGGDPGVNCLASPPTPNSFQLRASAFPGARSLAFRRVAAQPRLVSISLRHGRSATCLFGVKGDVPADEGSGASLWKSLGNAMGNFKKKSLDDVLRQQIHERELTGGGRSGGPPRGGGGGGGGGGHGSGNKEDGRRAEKIHEFLQVVFATLGFIFIYLFMIYGELLYRLGRDYIKYLFGAKPSKRLRRTWLYRKRFGEDKSDDEEGPGYYGVS